jgi:hypothetical protein
MKGLERKKGAPTGMGAPFISSCTDGEINTSQRYKIYVPLDYIKAKLIDVDLDHLKRVLNFSEPVNTSTGEIVLKRYPDGTYKKPKKYAQWFNLVFEIQYSNKNQCEEVTVMGSLHKFSNKGLHNYNDFTIESFTRVLRAFRLYLGVTPSNFFIYRLEWGVNIQPPISTNSILEHCLLFHWKKFRSPFTNYLEGGDENNYLLKLYNKGYQFNLDGELMRIERKQLDWYSFCKVNKIGRTLQNLINSDFKGMREALINNWEEVLFYDPELIKKNRRTMKFRDVFYWMELSAKRSRTTRLNHWNKLRELNRLEGADIQNQITELINLKIDELNSDVFTLSELVFSPNPSTSNLRIISTHYGLVG